MNDLVLTVFGYKGKFAQYFLNNIFTDYPYFGIEKSHTPLTTEQKLTIKNSKILLFCTPYTVTQTLLQELNSVILPHHTLIDICSVKSNLYNLDSVKAGNIISLHPLYSPNSTPAERTCTLSIIRGTTLDLFHKYFTIKEVTIQQHDQTMAIVQAAIHFQNYVTAHFLTQHPINIETNLYTQLHTVLQQQLSQNIEMMMEIQLYNPYTKAIIDQLTNSFMLLQKAIQNNDHQQVKCFIETAVKCQTHH